MDVPVFPRALVHSVLLCCSRDAGKRARKRGAARGARALAAFTWNPYENKTGGRSPPRAQTRHF